SLDDMATPSLADDEITDFSSAGPTATDGWVKPDLVTSGRSVVSLAAPGSTIYDGFPSARIGSGNFVGSGTSFSAAIASGAAALVLADKPDLAPNQIKARLLASADPGPIGNPFVDGHGALDADAAATSGPADVGQSAGLAATLYGATVSLQPDGSADTWNATLWSPAPSGQPGDRQWDGDNWNGGDWNGSAWDGKAWNYGAWSGATWNGADWTGKAWNDAGWQGSSWDGTAWVGKAWNQSSWS
ncbi:MAG: S8 family serine peptidase, partial [Streptosporangiaceae bacterium]